LIFDAFLLIFAIIANVSNAAASLEFGPLPRFLLLRDKYIKNILEVQKNRKKELIFAIK